MAPSSLSASAHGSDRRPHAPTTRTLRACLLALAAGLAVAAATTQAAPPAAAAGAPPLVSGEPLRVGGPHGLGPLSIGLSNYPVGVVRLTGGQQPDLIAIAGRFSHPPGLFLLPWQATTREGTPVFGKPVELAIEGVSGLPPSPLTVLEAGGEVFLVTIAERREARIMRLDRQKRQFIRHAAITLPRLPRQPTSLAVLPNPDGSIELLMAISDATRYRPDKPDWRDPAFIPYDGTGRWIGGYPHLALYAVHAPSGLGSGRSGELRRVSPTEREILLRGGHLTRVDAPGGQGRDLVVGTWWGDLLFYRNPAASGTELARRTLIRDPSGRVLRHPSCAGHLVAYPGADGRTTDLLVGGEGAVYFYRATGEIDADGVPTYAQPVPVLQRDAELYAGSLPVPNLVDWDGDGLPDLIVGNSEGRLLLFRNIGTAAAPAFAPGVALAAGGEEILIQPGARGSLQGPAEARWGYLSPTAVDWNGNGQLDIVASSSTAEHIVWMGMGERPPSRLRAAQTLLADGLELRGTWRCKPGAGLLGGRMAYVALNDHDRLHLYWRIDDRHLEDGGELRLVDGRTIQANFLSAGGTGRSKIVLFDWDGDGVTDLLIGTPRHGSIPDPDRGIPQSLGLPGAAVLFLRNAGTDSAPVFELPAIITHDGRPLYFGQHECAPAVGELAGELCLIVGQEDGRLVYFQKSRLGLFRPRFDL